MIANTNKINIYLKTPKAPFIRQKTQTHNRLIN